MSGKPITISQSEYEVLSRAKAGYEDANGETIDWGRFLLVLLGTFISSELRENARSGYRATKQKSNKTS